MRPLDKYKRRRISSTLLVESEEGESMTASGDLRRCTLSDLAKFVNHLAPMDHHQVGEREAVRPH